MVRRRAVRRGVPTTAALLLLTGVLAACDSGEDPQPAPTASSGPAPNLTFGVFGNDAEVAAYQAIVDTYSESTPGVQVELRSWPTAAALGEAVVAGEETPDVYLLSRTDLERVTEAGKSVPLLELIDERGVDFGDGYSRESLLAFSAEDEQQCMPYGVSPMVVYYNTELIDFEVMAERDLDAPTPDDEGRYPGWSFEQFRAAAEFSSRPRRRTKGVSVEPTLRGLAPFIYSGGGNLYDDDTEPTSLDLSSDESREALTTTLELLRDPAVTLTEEELARATPVEWFKRGRLGMIAGFRSMLPELRAASRLEFDVMPMPTLDDAATIGDLTGLCLAPGGSAKVSMAADFLVYVASAEAVARVATAGYLVPANLQVAQSADFLQPEQRPEHADVFNASIGDIRLPPLVEDFDALEAAVRDPLRLLFTMPVPDIEALTTQVDEESRVLLDPDADGGEEEQPTELDTPDS